MIAFRKQRKLNMGKEITLFTNYSGKENRITNYIGLVLKLIYRKDPSAFQNIINSLLQDRTGISSTPTMEQQRKQKSSIPDLLITQKSYSVYFETKIEDWHYNEQIEAHLKGLDFQKSDVKIMFLLANFNETNFDNRFNKTLKIAEDLNIILQPISYDDLINSIENESANFDNAFLETIVDFRIYLESSNLLQTWRNLLDVVNCTSTMEEINDLFYACPNTGGAYSHHRAKYFGPYKNKLVETIYEIKAVVLVEKGGLNASVKWNNSDIPDIDLKKEAKDKLINSPYEWRQKEIATKSLQVFLLADGFKTRFEKISSGGMQNSKRYFKLRDNLKTSSDVADYLLNTTWE